MTGSLDQFFKTYKTEVENRMIHFLEDLNSTAQLKEAMRYSVNAGGKRIRPLLLMASYLAYAKDVEKTYSSAAALEFIHTYSLIHDDLPAMDDDDIRRGKPTNHKAFDEATAILAGDALLTYSFEIVAQDDLLSDREKVYLIKLLSETSGPNGMVAGQVLDMAAESKYVDLEALETIHKLKTGELLKFAVRAGAYLGQATDEQISHLDQYAHYMGLIFQVQDDILDVIGEENKIGKPVKSDEGNLKSTYPQLLGIDGAIQQKERYAALAKEALQNANADESYLFQLIDYFSKRDH
ncbi:polyprenyl synthetase family protein [Lentibacillus saliphilus]|uniref:polyprenyl synthetase family protein n=1 Tax=Lentibacillus saliphilus TaxID=2737028 RepID=UPI001C2F3491|nr:farnesyl diphosphate synthase [Lentibacillus saliphilus]